MEGHNPNFIERLLSPTPKFFKKVRAIGGTLVAVTTFLLSTNIEMSGRLRRVAEDLFIAGTVMTIVAQSTVKSKTV